ncbi:hypothetical protein MCFN_00305 [Mycoplasmopsis californica]|uniref:Uncharacterized protein n=1 Tax=Mycoplasmopsis californica TaxID=2113 RepID=A0A059XQF6_9BACT|nr:hypothetical protein [Mycoplasmopsis californica]AIA29240.1 hypothetical protein MCFN_00305 [Mycoplasmopsis californica]
MFAKDEIRDVKILLILNTIVPISFLLLAYLTASSITQGNSISLFKYIQLIIGVPLSIVVLRYIIIALFPAFKLKNKTVFICLWVIMLWNIVYNVLILFQMYSGLEQNVNYAIQSFSAIIFILGLIVPFRLYSIMTEIQEVKSVETIEITSN